jgi:hypothetical protein
MAKMRQGGRGEGNHHRSELMRRNSPMLVLIPT